MLSTAMWMLFMGDINIQSVTRGDVHTTLKKLHVEESIKNNQKPRSDSAIGNRITRAIERLLEAELIISDQLEDDETYYYPSEPWVEMSALIKLKFPSVNFAKVSFL